MFVCKYTNQLIVIKGKLGPFVFVCVKSVRTVKIKTSLETLGLDSPKYRNNTRSHANASTLHDLFVQVSHTHIATRVATHAGAIRHENKVGARGASQTPAPSGCEQRCGAIYGIVSTVYGASTIAGAGAGASSVHTTSNGRLQVHLGHPQSNPQVSN